MTVPGVHPNDPNYAAHPEHYFQAGRSAVRFIELAKEAAEVRRPLRRILDLPCGYGRVMRNLREAFPDAELTACDISTEAVDFCAEAFGANPVYSNEDPAKIALDGPFGLIWCGSLLTHVDADRWEAFLDLFESRLDRRGLLVFTTCGRQVAAKLRAGEDLGVAAEAVEGLLMDYEREGFAYRDYPAAVLGDMSWASRGYGLSLASPSWVCARVAARPGLRLVSFLEAGFNYNQDAVACLRSDALTSA
jgi:SAM-dependent methyltransferase